MTKRQITYDLMRIIAILAVITIHVSAENWYQPTVDNYWLINNFINSLAHPWAVPLFISISGALLLKKDLDYKTIFKKYIPRILLCLIVWHFVYYFFGTPKFTMANFLNGLKELANGNSFSHLWYLYFVLGLYLILPFISKLVKALDKKYLLILIIITAFIGIVIPTIKSITKFDLGIYTETYQIFFFDEMFTYLLLGYYLSEYKIKNNKAIIGISLLAIILLVLNAWYGNHISIIKNATISYASTYNIVAIPMVIAITSIIYKLFSNKESKLITTLGELTFGTYLIHFMIIKGLTKYHITANIINPIFGNIILIIGVAIVAYLISFIISKIPYVRKIIGLK